MKIKLLGKNLNDVRPLLPRFGLEESAEDFELVITHGGDGALLGAEREYPGVPKLPLRDAATAPTCPEHELSRRLAAFAAGSLPLSYLPKVAARWQEREFTALNDVFLHTGDVASALRYRVMIDGELYANEVVGDGVCFCTVHGSSAYYRSITHSLFRVGVGLAFSNSTEEVNHLVLAPEARVKVEITRGPGILVADNSPERLTVPEGGVVEFYSATEKAAIWGLADFMCPRCRMLRHPHKFPFSGLPR